MLQQVARCPANRHVVQAAVLVWQVLAAAAPSLLIEAGATVGDAVLYSPKTRLVPVSYWKLGVRSIISYPGDVPLTSLGYHGYYRS